MFSHQGPVKNTFNENGARRAMMHKWRGVILLAGSIAFLLLTFVSFRLPLNLATVVCLYLNLVVVSAVPLGQLRCIGRCVQLAHVNRATTRKELTASLRTK